MNTKGVLTVLTIAEGRPKYKVDVSLVIGSSTVRKCARNISIHGHRCRETALFFAGCSVTSGSTKPKRTLTPYNYRLSPMKTRNKFRQ